MIPIQAMETPRPERSSGGAVRAPRPRLFAGIAEQYRALKRRLADMLVRGDRDYALLSALSQEIGKMRQKIRADLQLRRAERKRRKAAKKATSRTIHGGREEDHKA
jgi:hypothetical protein